MPLYFPRSKSEEDFSAYHLPYDVGNEDGEPIIAERQIRIISKPTFTHAPVQDGVVIIIFFFLQTEPLCSYLSTAE